MASPGTQGTNTAGSDSTAVRPATPLQCTLSVNPILKAGRPVEVTFKLSNSTAQPQYVLNWNTPLEGLKNNILEVSRVGTDTELPYQGPMFKRGEPAADNYVTVPPGGSVEGKIDASLAYDFSQPGPYRIAFRGPILDVTTKQAEVPRALAQHRAMPVECPTIETTISAP
ncbi:MAG: protease [Hyalangium sp.]|uniref:protease n=1 Tax=Hyalangium sp. TaxID=2028555 RepID=UPI00389B1E1C